MLLVPLTTPRNFFGIPAFSKSIDTPTKTRTTLPTSSRFWHVKITELIDAPQHVPVGGCITISSCQNHVDHNTYHFTDLSGCIAILACQNHSALRKWHARTRR